MSTPWKIVIGIITSLAVLLAALIASPYQVGYAVGYGVVISMCLAVYGLPTVVALARHKRNVAAIAATNVLLGWTVLGWAGALIWALVREDSEPHKYELEHQVDEARQR